MVRKFNIIFIFVLVMVADQRFPGNAMHPDKTSTEFPIRESQVRLFFSGDVMTGRGIDQVLPQHVDPEIYESYVKDARDYVKLAEKKSGPIPQPISYSYIWGDALEIWRKMAPDLKIINLETSITDHPEPWPGKEVQYRMHPANVAVLKIAGIDICTLANNHTLDWKRLGLLETLQTLRKAGIHYTGAGENAAKAREPAIHKVRNSRIIVFAYGSESSGIPESWAANATNSGVNLLPDLSAETLEIIKAQVKNKKKPGDIVVFSVHWGSNWGHEIPPNHRQFAHQLIDEAGVDLIHGHSSHHPRGIEVYKNKLILYGAGDFINDYEGIDSFGEFRGDLSLMYFPEMNPVTGKLTGLKMVPMQMRNFRLNRASAADAKWLANVLDRESGKFGTRVTLLDDGSLAARW